MVGKRAYWQRAVVAVLTVVLVLAGTGRALLLADAHEIVPVTIDGVVLTICHTVTDPAPPSSDTPQHNCCDACLLMAATVLPVPPAVPLPIAHDFVVDHVDAMPWVPAFARLKTPRLAQGPPAA